MSKIRILLADDHQIIREGLNALIGAEDDMEVLGEACNGREAVELSGELDPDVVVMDIEMSELNGIEATRQIKSCSPETRVLMLSVHYNRRSVSESVRAGASGYLLKECAFEELCSAIRKLMSGKTYVASKSLDVLMEDYIRLLHENGDSGLSPLTSRETEVLQLLAEGYHTKKIGRTLGISPKTVETHIANIKKKTSLRSVAELTRYAIEEGITHLDR